jgi:hypothetical protein
MTCSGTVTRIDGHNSDVRLKSTSGVDLICQLLSVFTAAPRCAETHSSSFVRLFMRVCKSLIEPIGFNQSTRQVQRKAEYAII